jgi:hypothetical protein
MKPSTVLALFIVLAPLATRAEPPPSDVKSDAGAGDVSFHVGAGISFLVVPSLQVQLEGKSWFAGAELAAGIGGWGFSTLVIGKAGYVSSLRLHPYLAIGAGFASAYDLDELSGSGFALTFEAGLLLGKERAWGRIMPFIELPIATWSVPGREGGTPWSPGVGYPLVGIRFLL